LCDKGLKLFFVLRIVATQPRPVRECVFLPTSRQYIPVTQRSRVVYIGIFHESLVFSRYIHEPFYFIACHTKYSGQHNQCHIRAVHDGKVGCNTVEYTTAFLYSHWLGIKCGIAVSKSQLVLFGNVMTTCSKFYLRTILALIRQRFIVFVTSLFFFFSRASSVALLESLE